MTQRGLSHRGRLSQQQPPWFSHQERRLVSLTCCSVDRPIVGFFISSPPGCPPAFSLFSEPEGGHRAVTLMSRVVARDARLPG